MIKYVNGILKLIINLKKYEVNITRFNKRSNLEFKLKSF